MRVLTAVNKGSLAPVWNIHIFFFPQTKISFWVDVFHEHCTEHASLQTTETTTLHLPSASLNPDPAWGTEGSSALKLFTEEKKCNMPRTDDTRWAGITLIKEIYMNNCHRGKASIRAAKEGQSGSPKKWACAQTEVVTKFRKLGAPWAGLSCSERRLSTVVGSGSLFIKSWLCGLQWSDKVQEGHVRWSST